MSGLSRKAAIVGIGATDFSKDSGAVNCASPQKR